MLFHFCRAATMFNFGEVLKPQFQQRTKYRSYILVTAELLFLLRINDICFSSSPQRLHAWTWSLIKCLAMISLPSRVLIHAYDTRSANPMCKITFYPCPSCFYFFSHFYKADYSKVVETLSRNHTHKKTSRETSSAGFQASIHFIYETVFAQIT